MDGVASVRRLLLALSFALWGFFPQAQAQGPIVGPGNVILCPNIATLTVGGTGLTQLVALLSGQRVYLCGWHITNTGSTGTFALSYGTGSNCAGGTTTIIPAQNTTSTAPATDH